MKGPGISTVRVATQLTNPRGAPNGKSARLASVGVCGRAAARFLIYLFSRSLYLANIPVYVHIESVVLFVLNSSRSRPLRAAHTHTHTHRRGSCQVDFRCF